MFTKRLALYIHAGLSLIVALDVIAEDARGTYALVLASVMQDIQDGIPLSIALSAFPRAFSVSYVQLIAASEASGTLSETLFRLSDTLSREQKLTRTCIAALAYPTVIALGAIGISAFLIFYAFPKIVPLFRGLHVQLPFTTRVLITLSSLITSHALLIVFLCVSIVGVSFYLHGKPYIRMLIDHSLVRAPFVGPVLREYLLAGIFRTIAVLLRGGVRIDAALALARASTSNKAYQSALERLEMAVTEGGTLSSAMRLFPKLYPTFTVHLIVAGEMTGTLSENAHTISIFFEERLENDLKDLTSFIEPMLLVLTGLIVGFVALAIISPMYSLTQSLSI